MTIEYIDDTDAIDRVCEVDYHYDKGEEGSRWLPPYPALIDYMKVTEDRIDVTNTLSDELFLSIEKACLADYFEPLD